MKRLDQGHLHPKLEVPGLTCSGRESNLATTVGGEHSRKEPFEQLINSYSEHLQYIHMSSRQFHTKLGFFSKNSALCTNAFMARFKTTALHFPFQTGFQSGPVLGVGHEEELLALSPESGAQDGNIPPWHFLHPGR
jgi:hypothetical protein